MQALIMGRKADGSYDAVAIDGEGAIKTVGGSAGASTDRELVVTTYVVKTGFAGASVGDTITCTQVIDVSGASLSTVSTVWRNQTAGADLASAPSAANLTLTGAGAATEATLAAVSAKLPATLGAKAAASSLAVTLSTDGAFVQSFGAQADAAASTDTATTSYMGLFKRLLSVKLADLIAGRSPVDTLGQPAVARQLSVSGTTANLALTSTCRRISIRARGCPMRYEVGVGAQTASATTSHFLDQDERLDLSVPAGAHIAAVAIPPWGSSTTGTGSLAITELV